MQELCQTCGLAVPSDVRAVEKLLSDGLAAMNSTDNGEPSLANLRNKRKLDKAEWEESLNVFQDKLNSSEHHVHELKHDQVSVQNLASKLGKAYNSFKKSEEQVHPLG